MPSGIAEIPRRHTNSFFQPAQVQCVDLHIQVCEQNTLGMYKRCPFIGV